MKTIKVMYLLVLMSAIASCSVIPKHPPSPPHSGFSSYYSNYLESATDACQESAEGIYVLAVTKGLAPQDALDIAKMQYFKCAKELDIII